MLNKKNEKMLFTILITSTIVISQDCNEDRESLNSLKKDVPILSDDKMEGRETGTKGEKISLKYIGKEEKLKYLSQPW